MDKNRKQADYSLLIVDDEELIRTGMKYGIHWEKAGIGRIITAASAREALAIVRKNMPDIIITDINMPEIDGLEYIRQVREIRRDVFILILTGYDRFDYAKRALKLKVDDFLLKPVDEAELLEITSSLLREREVQEEGEADQGEERNEIVRSAKCYIRDNLNRELTVTGIAEELHISANYLSRLFKRVTDEGCSEYITRMRMEKAKSLLDTTLMRIGEIADAVGYRDIYYFSLTFKKVTGLSPSQYRKKEKEI